MTLVRSCRHGHRALRRTSGALFAAAILLVASAHVGSPDTWFAGDAGPYRVLVHVRSPGVIPGIAQVTVQVEGEPPTEVLAHVNRFDAVFAPPPPDVAEPVRGEPGTYRTELWVMTSGSNSVTVRVRGPRGEGAVVVPATIVAFRRLEFSPPMALALGAAGVFLIAGLVTIVGAGVRESVLPAGVQPDARMRRRGVFGMVIAGAVIGLVLTGGKIWWDVEDRAYRAAMFRPLGARAEVAASGAGSELRFIIADETWRPTGPQDTRAYSMLVPDHGRLMHLFAVRDDLGALAHLHPETTDTVTFAAALPALPGGKYLLFGDITHESGFTQTLVTSVEIPEGRAPAVEGAGGGSGSRADGADSASGSQADDAWFSGAPAQGDLALLADGSSMRWERAGTQIVAGVPAPLRFVVQGPDGSPAVVEPYMGMDGHAVVVREDGGVFIHLHPMGTVSAASQLAFELRAPTDTAVGMLAPRVAAADAERAQHTGALHAPAASALSFPYAFPTAGRYRIWVQVKREGRVLTGAFPVEVAEATP